MKYLIVGIGNIGTEYEETRHNIGFKVLDQLAKENDATFKAEKHGAIAEVKYKGRTLVLLKPSTYVNLSGKAVNYWMQQEKISIENIMIVVDDLALPFGKLRIRAKGSDAGHNGIKDITKVLGRADYPRLRFGIGSEFSKGKQIDYVLGEWSKEEKLDLSIRMDAAIKAIESFTTIGIERTMNFHNTK
ncbi:aminoacyl-tRNA hydrolase [Halosquirtibacter laminarini]|uniref:Aminoacyl-tRNA hydrolase n=1 Tax=Halosquirtibacter laminarini TaxID=3374600 RepID=A0AC61NMC6_9BACT|nr:aminoacyl-tRNA hydrolase [Prolixibacteraceae bacterium]